MKKRLLALLLAASLLLGSCAPAREAAQNPASESQGAEPAASQEVQDTVPQVEGLTFVEQLPLSYAECFAAYRYQGDYWVLTVTDGRQYLVVPEGAALPEGCQDYIILQQPLDNIYLVATSAMALFRAIDGIGSIRLSGAKEEAWYIEEAAQAMREGDILYAGKYSEPDYELLTAQGCDLSLQSTMIYHNPQVLEKIEELGVPVFIDRSSYESHPLGRTEWMKLYGILLGKVELAQERFEEQARLVEELSDFPNTEKTVAFFYVTSSGIVSVRKSNDYLATMIELAGGRYIFPDLMDSGNASSAVTLTMEEFYASAKDADYLIYNATIDAPLYSVEDLLDKSALFEDFKAVQEDKVWCTGKYLYQATDILGEMIRDIHIMLSGSGEEQTFIYHLPQKKEA